MAGSLFNWENIRVANLFPHFFRKNEKSKILVIEDDDEMGAMIKKSLRSRISYMKPLHEHDFDFEYMDNFSDVVEYFIKEDRVDLIVIDWNLKADKAGRILQMLDDQIELTLTAEKLFKKTPVIILTPDSFRDWNLDLKHFYLYKVVPRDVEPEKLIQSLSSTVQSALTH